MIEMVVVQVVAVVRRLGMRLDSGGRREGEGRRKLEKKEKKKKIPCQMSHVFRVGMEAMWRHVTSH